MTTVIDTRKIMVFVFLLVIAGQTAVDLYLPSLPAMVSYFHTTNNIVQLTLSFFVFGYAGSQIIYGPLSDHFGRRPILIFGLGIFTLSSLLCAISPTIEVLLLFRFLQGLGAGALNVHQRILIRDVFEGNVLNKNASYVATAWAIVPLVAPVVGGYIQFYFNWKMNFLVLALGQFLLLLAIIKKLPETRRKNDTSILTLKKIIIDYKTLLTSRIFMGSAICCALLNGVFLAFNAVGPFYLQDRLGLTSVMYGWSLVIAGSGFLIGSYVNSCLIQYYAIYKIMFCGFSLIFVGDVLLLFCSACHFLVVEVLILPMCILFFGIGLVYSNSIAGGIKHFREIAGSAGAVFGFMVSAVGGLISVIFSRFSSVSLLPMSLTIAILSFMSFMIYLAWVLKAEDFFIANKLSRA